MKLRGRSKIDDVSGVQPPEPAATNPDHAWKALTLVNEWLRHSETKLATTLAGAGVTGGVLFNLVKNDVHRSIWFNMSAVICFVGVLCAAGAAVAGLFPRLRLKRSKKAADELINPLFFHDIARGFKGDAPSYAAVLHTLTTTPDDLVRHIGHQVHANSVVAQRKFRCAEWAIRFLVLGLLGLVALAGVIAQKL
ncbi:Pycsar system effector family protein [Mycobacterium sp. AT1]|uniref:Pycsar system effector family protein n=1 Tax=Mycobacterium sp. AT1 TaxID=1961706 RepID=UPI001153907E|nr:Pycsar system effector family protein [Mycobacterium sp. AT1]